MAGQARVSGTLEGSRGAKGTGPEYSFLGGSWYDPPAKRAGLISGGSSPCRLSATTFMRQGLAFSGLLHLLG